MLGGFNEMREMGCFFFLGNEVLMFEKDGVVWLGFVGERGKGLGGGGGGGGGYLDYKFFFFFPFEDP